MEKKQFVNQSYCGNIFVYYNEYSFEIISKTFPVVPSKVYKLGHLTNKMLQECF